MRKITGLLIVMVLSAGIAQAGTSITVKGSDTLVRLGQRWAEEYMKSHPEVVIQVSGGGTGTGIAALLNGTTDICQASRNMKEKEYSLAGQKGLEIVRIAVALDGIAVFVHESNPVDRLSFAQLKGIYSGSITNWKEVGGNDARIILYGRENNSGTYTFFKEHVLDNDEYSDYTQTLPGTAAVVNAVSKDKNGIGYGGIAWAAGVKFASISKNDIDEAVTPSMQTVSQGAYPISRELYWFFNGIPAADIRDFVNWALSPDGQKLAEKIEYVPLPAGVALENMFK